MPSPIRGLLGRPLLLALLVTGVIAAMLTTPAAQARPAGHDVKSTSHSSKAVKQARAERALDRVRSIFNGHARGRDATMALRDLSRLRGDLRGADAQEAAVYNARPVIPSELINCSATFCIHWAAASVDPTDVSPANGISDYIDTVATTLTDVQNTYIGAGYRAVKGDDTRGGNSLPDIYIDNIGPQGLYGYCNSDDVVPNAGPYDTSAYCALDNDYSPAEFPTNTPIENLQVTVAHEYFHAVQFAYDRYEDSWFMEATATWAEDELYDAVDDNLQYLPSGNIGHPEIPLDAFTGSHQYGNWLFIRYLTEKYTAAQGGLPTLVRKIWEKLDGATGGPDKYSSEGINLVLGSQGSSLAKEFAKFADANRRPGKVYSEGNQYPTAPLGSFSKKSGWYVTKLDHLTSATGRYKPGSNTHKLKITVDLAKKSTSPLAIVSVYLKSGSVKTSFISLSSDGNGSDVFPFGSTVKSVEVTLVNGSARFSCWQGSPFSCQGNPADENLTAKVKGAVK